MQLQQLRAPLREPPAEPSQLGGESDMGIHGLGAHAEEDGAGSLPAGSVSIPASGHRFITYPRPGGTKLITAPRSLRSRCPSRADLSGGCVSAVSPARPAVPAGAAHHAPHHEAARRASRRPPPRPTPSRSRFPAVSVVVPTRNEARNLEIILPAIAAVRPAVHEIIVVDGNSTDGSIEAAKRV